MTKIIASVKKRNSDKEISKTSPKDLSTKMAKKNLKVTKALSESKAEVSKLKTDANTFKAKKKPKKQAAVTKDVEMKSDNKETVSVVKESPKLQKKDKVSKKGQKVNGPKLSPVVNEKNVLYVSHIGYNTKLETVEEYFSRYGKLIKVILPKRAGTTRNKSFAFVSYVDNSSMMTALAKRDHKIEGRSIIVSPRIKKLQDEPEKRKKSEKHSVAKTEDKKGRKIYKNSLFVGGLNYITSEKKLELYFKKFGKVVNVTLPLLRKCNRNKGYCFVSYKDASSLEKAVAYQKHQLDQKRFKVEKRKEVVDHEQKKEEREPKFADNTNKIFIGGFNKKTDKKSILQHFSKYGKVAGILLKKTSKKPNLGYCFLLFEERTGMEASLKTEHKIDGTVLDVQPAVMKNKKKKKSAEDAESSDDDDEEEDVDDEWEGDSDCDDEDEDEDDDYEEEDDDDEEDMEDGEKVENDAEDMEDGDKGEDDDEDMEDGEESDDDE